MKLSVLDSGSVELIDSWGSDEAIIEAARQSTQKGFKSWGGICPDCNEGWESDGWEDFVCRTCKGEWKLEGDEKLLHYLWKHKHSTPFEFAGMVIEIEAPIFIFREWHRHRTQSYSEASARYGPLPNLNYLPSIERILINADSTNKQANRVGGSVPATAESAKDWLEGLSSLYESIESLYRDALEKGIPKELARIILPVGRYSKMRASANLRNWLAFLTLRLDEGAQWEIRQYAKAVSEIVSFLFPRTYELFSEGA